MRFKPKLSDSEVRNIRNAVKRYGLILRLQALHGVSYETIRKARRGISYKWVK